MVTECYQLWTSQGQSDHHWNDVVRIHIGDQSIALQFRQTIRDNSSEIGQHFVGSEWSLRSASRLTKRMLDLCMGNVHLSLPCTKRWWEPGVGERQQQGNVDRFKPTKPVYASLNQSVMPANLETSMKTPELKKTTIPSIRPKGCKNHPSWVNCSAKMCVARRAERCGE